MLRGNVIEIGERMAPVLIHGDIDDDDDALGVTGSDSLLVELFEAFLELRADSWVGRTRCPALMRRLSYGIRGA